MKKLIKLILILSCAITCTNISAMEIVKRLSDSRIGHFVSNTWAKTKLNTLRYTQEELNKKLFDTVSIDPDKKISVIKKLIERGANVNYIDEKTKFPILYTAIAAGHLGENEKTMALLINNKKINLKTKINITGKKYAPLDWARLVQCSSTVIKLLEKKTNNKK